jgi:hypothetical protein
MFRSLTLTACSAITISSFAQKEKADIPAFGKVEKADLEIKECDFDAKAEAVVLFDAGELYCDIATDYPNMQMERHIRIKILKDKGKKEADIHLPYMSYRVNRKKMLKAPATSPPVTVQEYENFKEFYKQLFAILSEQIAIKKKG